MTKHTEVGSMRFIVSSRTPTSPPFRQVFFGPYVSSAIKLTADLKMRVQLKVSV